ncbi:hypothetical protein TPAR_08603 [Tolypocladium paradoxum]|uniref:Uncharacterized protein n=1 Tax=Tolypocladium paradoxum TaxID=94208 RepID=A0A2S4KLX6_9HYPO|nr:hypothetical protein TPAR_08603 [Tolypocladium paradoxum]
MYRTSTVDPVVLGNTSIGARPSQPRPPRPSRARVTAARKRRRPQHKTNSVQRPRIPDRHLSRHPFLRGPACRLHLPHFRFRA